MPYTQEQLDAAARNLPSAETTRRKLEHWRKSANLTWPQVADLCGRGMTGVKRFASDKYLQTADSDVFIRRDIEEMMRRFPVGPSSRDTAPFYETENTDKLRTIFSRTQQEQAISVIYGPPGSQKSFALKHLVYEFNRKHLAGESNERAFYVYCTRNVPPRDMLRRLCENAGVVGGQTVHSCITSLKLKLRTTRALFVMDEANNMPIDSMEVLRELHDEDPKIGILLAGSHKLRKIFDENAGELEQWNSRISGVYTLDGVSRERAFEIAKAELPNASMASLRLLVDSSLVKDSYARRKPNQQVPTYHNVRRIFESIKAFRRKDAA